MAIKTSTTKRRMAAPAAPCCPEAGDLVVLATANPMFEGGTTRGFREDDQMALTSAASTSTLTAM